MGNSEKSILLSTASFPPIQYISKLIRFESVFIDQHENFLKQTFRNRYVILTANGPVSLVIPIAKGRDKKIKIKDLKISYDTDWQTNHWRTLFSAYNNSPFFKYYSDDFINFFEKKYQNLLELNLEIHRTICSILGIKYNLKLTEGFEEFHPEGENYREAFSPKKRYNIVENDFNLQPYTQVFSEKFNFVPNLSILDLIFNEGPNSLSVLNSSRITN